MLWGNADENSENKNAESVDNNSLESLQKQNVEMRSESSEQETESESNDLDWEQPSAVSVNLSQNISAIPSTTLLEVYQTQEKWELQYPINLHLIEVGCAIYVANTVKGMNIEGLLKSNCMSTPQRHSNITWKVKNILTQKRKKQIKNLLSKGSIYKQILKKKDSNPEMLKRETAA